jgi:ubiquinol-cytochrome c reductase cytochrome b subunit
MTSRPRTSRVAEWADDRLNLAAPARKYLRKVFPDHWSFMLGEIALWSFVVLLLTGVFLTLWFKPDTAEVVYNGSFDPLRGVAMSSAYASTLEISFDVRGGLLIRQMHHWAAMLFIAAMLIHLMRVFVTGAFRKPREITWLVGGTMLLLGVLEGFVGYSLPDDLLSGTGLRIADGLVKATPVVGGYLSFLLFGGEFPGDQAIPRLYILHVLLIPGLLLALVAVHLILVFARKHTQWPGPGRTERNVIGYPLLPVYTAKATGFFFVVFGVTALMGAVLSINPLWRYGPYDAAKVTAGSQPDWYLGFTEGALRIMPGWETHLFGYTLSWNLIIPGLVLPVLLWFVVLAYPFVEGWVTGDEREHHLLQRPRDVPARTAFLAGVVTFYGLLWAAGGNDVIATRLHLDVNEITWFMRVAVFVGPTLAYVLTRRICLGLQAKDRETLAHGRETGVIMRDADGGYHEKHVPLGAAAAFRLTTNGRDVVPPAPPDVDANGTPPPHLRTERVRARLAEAMHADDRPAASTDDEQESGSLSRAETGRRPVGRG